jgi:hypothetical protein
LVASPGDTFEERAIAAAVIGDLNKLQGPEEGFVLEPLLWERDSYPGLGVDAQDVINRELEDYQIFIGIMSTRFGSPTHRADSGTEEEFDRALDKWLTHPDDIRILFYFRNPNVKFLDIDIEQALKVHAFRTRIQTQGLLVKDYSTPGDFRPLLYMDLLRVVRELLRPEVKDTPQPHLTTKATTTPVDCGSWHATYKKSGPQGASHKTIFIAQYGASPLRLTGSFQSNSPYFRFGFKLLGLRGRGFSAGSVQSEEKNVLVHIGKNVSSSDLFLMHYRNGLRVGSNVPILKYEDCRELPIELTINSEYLLSLIVEHNSVYEAYIDPEIKARLMLFAWGDEHDYGINFNGIVLHVG